MEILAPAGNRDSLQAAVRSGADSVYLGASAFNARQNADNFNSLALPEAVGYCHARGVKVYVTLNTLLFDSEREAFIRCASEVAEAGADYVIMQDLGALSYVKKICPSLPVCASTQMAVHNAEGVRMLEDLGVHQAVLARELSLEEIRFIAAHTSVRLEAFVHGAHCMSVSGMCYLSSALGERSGNRGLCAQPCRLDFSCRGRGYALSLKDLSFVSHVREMREAGISALKIEGRMKRPEYVAAAVTAVREALAGRQPDLEGLKNVFSRSGFTDGYLVGKRNADMFGIRSEADIASSKKVLGQMAALYRNEFPGVSVDMELTAASDKMRLEVSDGTRHVITEQPTELSDTAPLLPEMAEKALRKCGGTPFYPGSVRCTVETGLPLSASKVGALRRETLQRLLEERTAVSRLQVFPCSASEVKRDAKPAVSYRVRFSDAEQAFFDERTELVQMPLYELKRHPELLSMPVAVAAELPELIWPQETQKVLEDLGRLKDMGLRHAVIAQAGMLAPLKKMGLTVHGGATLNITNSDALSVYAEHGLDDTLLSTELTCRQCTALSTRIPRGSVVYGRPPLMFYRSCPARDRKGCGGCSGSPVLTDRLGKSFPLVCHDKRYTTMHNTVPVYSADLNWSGIDFVLLYFTFETKEEAKSLLNAAYLGLPPDIPYTRGHALKAVR